MSYELVATILALTVGWSAALCGLLYARRAPVHIRSHDEPARLDRVHRSLCVILAGSMTGSLVVAASHNAYPWFVGVVGAVTGVVIGVGGVLVGESRYRRSEEPH